MPQGDDGTALRLVHGRLLGYIAAHNALSKATLELADSIVEFYSPEVRTCLVCVQCATAHCDCSCLLVFRLCMSTLEFAMPCCGRWEWDN